MAKHRVTFEVDNNQLFDTLLERSGDTSFIGQRLVGVMLVGRASTTEAVGMAVYGIKLVDVTDLPETPKEG